MGISIRAYARHRGVSHTAVEKAVAAGRITPLADGSIDSAVADVKWAQNTFYPQAGGGNAEFAKARTVHEHYRARLAKLAYDEKAGTLVSKAQVQTAAFNEYRRFRDAMLGIPDRGGHSVYIQNFVYCDCGEFQTCRVSGQFFGRPARLPADGQA